MTFRSPLWLWLAAAAPLALVFFLARERARALAARRLTSDRLRGVSNPARPLRPFVLALAIVAAAVALAGPQFGFVTVPIVDREANRILVVDVSNSMASEDVGASRLAAAKAMAKRLIESADGRVGLVAFESSSEIMSPLTNDGEAVLALVETLQPGEVGDPGSDIGGAIMNALKLLQTDATQKADVVIISDGEEQGLRLSEALHRARSRGIEISTILVGTTEGGTIPLPGGGVLRDDSNQIVTTRAHPEVMQRIAAETGGRFLANPYSEHALDALLSSRARGPERNRPVRMPVDRYQWPLAVAFAAFFCGSLINRGAE